MLQAFALHMLKRGEEDHKTMAHVSVMVYFTPDFRTFISDPVSCVKTQMSNLGVDLECTRTEAWESAASRKKARRSRNQGNEKQKQPTGTEVPTKRKIITHKDQDTCILCVTNDHSIQCTDPVTHIKRQITDANLIFQKNGLPVKLELRCIEELEGFVENSDNVCIFQYFYLVFTV